MNPAKDEKKIQEILDGIPRPEFLTEVRFRLDYDGEGDPAVMAMGIVKDREDVREYVTMLRPYDEAFMTAIRQSDLGYWPYINYRTESDQKEADEEEAQEREKRDRKRRKRVVAA